VRAARVPRRMSERRSEQLEVLRTVLDVGVPMMWAALGAGLHRSTALRWLDRLCRGDVLAHRRGPHPTTLTAAAALAASTLVRELHGLIGADSLRHSVTGLTRRQAARIKRETCQAVERERRARTRRVAVVAPGILRGFDAMELCSPGASRRHALIAADGCVPFRTSWTISPVYDARAVVDLLEKDFRLHGPPLVLRFDRAKAHVAHVVDELLQANGVLPLHGPPHYARYYGQLERQNREHRAWLGDHAVEREDLEDMMVELNEHWRRSTLGWHTAGEVWRHRPAINIDRSELGHDVGERALRITRKLGPSASARDLAWRLAVKQTLVDRGLLRVQTGGWC
jgi:hypothetical protein